MGEERIELEKLTIVLFQSLAVLFSAYIVSLFKNAEYTPQSIAILYLLHFVVFYISNLANRFYARGYLDELLQVLKYNVFFSVAITFTWFMMEGFFSISRRGMIYFFLLNTLSVYVMDWKSFSWGTDWCDGYGYYTFHPFWCADRATGSNDGFRYQGSGG